VQTGAFGLGFAEWNDRYRDGVRRFFRGDAGQLSELVTRLAGSSDVFEGSGRGPLASINFVTSHDGRSLRDLVSYERKYNEANGWDNRDGSDNEHARNWGEEGQTERSDVNALRERVARSMLLTLICSQGVPMLRQGDEIGQSTHGNNNAYTQDNPLTWMPWSFGASERELLRFVSKALELRRTHSALRRERYFTGVASDGQRDVTWLRPDGQPLAMEQFADSFRRSLGVWLAGDHAAEEPSLLLLVNSGDVPEIFTLPLQPAAAASGEYDVLIDSAEHPAPLTPVRGQYTVRAHSVALLAERRDEASIQQPATGRTTRSPEHVRDLRLLAERYGIASAYRGYHGTQNTTTDDTRVVLLRAMGVDAASGESARAALVELDAEAHRPGVEPVRVLPRESDALRYVDVRVPNDVSGSIDYELEVELETGGRLRRTGQLSVDAPRIRVPLPDAALPTGYHGLRLRLGASLDTRQDLIVTPRACADVASRLGGRLGAGLWSHLYSLQREGGSGIGDASDLRALVELAADQRLDFVAVNPLHAVDNNSPVVSPYYPLSRIYGNPIYIDPEQVPELASSPAARAILESPETKQLLANLRDGNRLDYARVWAWKRTVLAALHLSFVERELGKKKPSARGKAFAQYVAEQGDALQDFAAFCAIGEHLGGDGPPVLDFHQFPEPLRDARGGQVAELRATLQDRTAFHAYLQFELDRQLGECQRAAREREMAIGVYGDLAVGNAPGGPDVWARRELFAAGVNLGAPPDIYSATGQDWGLLPLVPLRLRQDRYRYVRLLFRSALKNVGMLRADHVMGLLRQFWVPWGRDARAGAYVRLPFEEITGILALESERAGALVVGEDLGVVPDGLRERMAELNLLRSQVLYFERDDAGEFVSPSSYAIGSLATVNSHDLPPLAAYFDGHDLELLQSVGHLGDDASVQRMRVERAAAKAALLRRLFEEGLWHEGGSEAEWVIAVHRLLVRTRAVLVAASVDDLCLEREPLNVPGIASAEHPAWARRMRLSLAQLASDPTALEIMSVLRERTRA
jgi:glycogen operon protein